MKRLTLASLFAETPARPPPPPKSNGNPKKRFRFESLFTKPPVASSQSNEKMVPENKKEHIIPFNDWTVNALAPKLAGTGLLYLCGPPGSGKKTLLRQASALQVNGYYCLKSLQLRHMPELRQGLQPTFDGKCLWTIDACITDDTLTQAM